MGLTLDGAQSATVPGAAYEGLDLSVSTVSAWVRFEDAIPTEADAAGSAAALFAGFGGTGAHPNAAKQGGIRVLRNNIMNTTPLHPNSLQHVSCFLNSASLADALWDCACWGIDSSSSLLLSSPLLISGPTSRALSIMGLFIKFVKLLI